MINHGKRWARLSLALAVMAAATSQAAERQHSVAVPDVRAVGDFNPKSIAALSSLIATEMARYRVKVVAGSDLGALVSLEKQKQLLDCTDSRCLSEIGGALAVEYLLISEVGEVGGRWLLTMALLDAVKGNALGRATKHARAPGELVDLVAPALEEITRNTALTLPVPAVAPAQAAAPAQVVHAPGLTGSSSRKITGFSLIGAGGAALAGGVICGALARDQHARALANPPASEAELSSIKGSIDRKLWAADGLFIGAAVAAAAGLVLVLTAPADSAAPSAKLSFAPVASGGALVASGGF